MKKLLSLELRRLIKHKSLYVCVIGVIACCFIVILTNKLLTSLSSGMEGNLLRMNFTGSYFLLNALSQSKIEIFLGVFIAIFVCMDFGEGTIRNIVSRGFTRIEIYFSKLFVCLIASFCIVILNLITGFVLGTIFGGVGDDWTIKILPLILSQLLTIIAYASIFVFFSLLLKKLGSALAVAIILPMFLPLLLTLVNAIFSKVNFDFTNLWLSGCMSSLTNINIGTKELSILLVTPSLYIVLSIVLTLTFFKKTEV